MSLLESEGQAEAALYPLWYLTVESEIAIERINGRHRTEAVLAAQAYASTQNKKSAKAFQKTLEKLG